MSPRVCVSWAELGCCCSTPVQCAGSGAVQQWCPYVVFCTTSFVGHEEGWGGMDGRAGHGMAGWGGGECVNAVGAQCQARSMSPNAHTMR